MSSGTNKGAMRFPPNRRGYKVSEPPARWPKKSRYEPPPDGRNARSRDADSDDYYRPEADRRGGRDNHDHGAPESSSMKDWNCMECQTPNHSKDEICYRCGLSALPLEEDFVSEKASKTEKKDEDVDEFGRRRPASAPPTRQWPPSFETNGSDYVLDNRSGMFYEARSDFFYDPTTKLYYSQDRQAYFRHRRKEGKSVFDKVEQTVEAFDADKVHETDQKMKVPAISINLKTKALPKKAKKRKAESDSQTTAASSLPPSQQKEHAADISKWSERQAERKPTASALPKPQPKRDLTKISRTAKGEPICTLCQRKFATVDQLFYHEKVSELHKTNLAKQEAEERNVAEVQKAPVVETTKPAYVDRAQHRRILHGPETPVTVAPVPAAARTAVVVTNTTVDPKDTLNESNIGNKLLQKLGWQQGKALGRGRSTAAVEVQQDWERIERLAGAHGKK